jgi:hypothetical protein
LERSFIFTVKIKNIGSQERIVSFDSSPVEAPDWLVILPAGRVMLPPGGEIEIAATFEPMIRPGVSQGELSYDFRLKFEDGEEVIPVNVKLKSLDWREDEKEEVEGKNGFFRGSNVPRAIQQQP